MFNENNALVIEIKNKILLQFIDAEIDIFYDKDQDEYFISTRNKELYYSDDYGKLIYEINQGDLWVNGIFNIYFILRENDTSVKEMSFSVDKETVYTSWNVDKTQAFNTDKMYYFNDNSLAA